MSILSSKIEEYIRKKQEAKKQDFCAASWLDSAAKRANQIAIATHVLKYTHSDAKGTSIYSRTEFDQSKYSQRYVSTSALGQNDIVGNAAAMDVAGLLQIEIDGMTLLDKISQGDSSPFASFADNEARLLSWMSGFKAVFVNQKLSSHTLAKQVYFPIDSDKYHLLSPLYATSLSQALYVRIIEDRYGEKAKQARESRKKEEFSDTVIFDYPDIAIQTFGGTKPQNISLLNWLRGGKSYLLKSAPPLWKLIQKPPIEKNSFWKNYTRKAKPLIKEFKEFLKVISKLESNKDIRIKVQNYVDQFIDLLILEAAEIQTLPPGWSRASKLPIHEQIWLDPQYEEVKIIKDQFSWMEHISEEFATLIIRLLKDNDLSLSDVNHRFLKDACFGMLKEIEI